MNIPTLIAGAVLAIILYLLISSMAKEKRSGKCSCGCSSCGEGCPHCLTDTSGKGESR